MGVWAVARGSLLYGCSQAMRWQHGIKERRAGLRCGGRVALMGPGCRVCQGVQSKVRKRGPQGNSVM